MIRELAVQERLAEFYGEAARLEVIHALRKLFEGVTISLCENAKDYEDHIIAQTAFLVAKLYHSGPEIRVYVEPAQEPLSSLVNDVLFGVTLTLYEGERWAAAASFGEKYSCVNQAYFEHFHYPSSGDSRVYRVTIE